MGICAYEARRTQAIRAWVGPEARGLFVPVVAELDASVQRLHSVSALAAPVYVLADVHPRPTNVSTRRPHIGIIKTRVRGVGEAYVEVVRSVGTRDVGRHSGVTDRGCIEDGAVPSNSVLPVGGDPPGELRLLR